MTQTAEELWFDQFGPAEYAPDLYRYVGVAKSIAGFDAFTDGRVEAFREQGYLVVDPAFTAAEAEAALEALLDLIDGRNPEFKGVQFEVSARDILPTLSRERKQDAVRKLQNYVDYDARLNAMAEHPQLLAVVTRLIGEQPALFANQAMLKPPTLGREKPWHQDHAFFNLPLGTPIVGVWVALDEATPENGCMHVVPGSHREGPTPHFRRRDWQICDTDVATSRIMAVPLQPGGCLFFDGLTHHGTPANASPRRRRALQLHYIPASVARISGEEHKAVFGGEIRGLTC